MISALAVFLAILVSSSAAPATPLCRAGSVEDRSQTYEYQNRQITIVGWTHYIDSERMAAENALAEAAQWADAGQCAKSEDIIIKFLSTSGDRLQEGQRVLDRLSALYQTKKFSVIGIEAAPESFYEYLYDASAGMSRVEVSFNRLVGRCPQLASKKDTFLTVFPGPDYVFASKKKGQVAQVPMESLALLEASLKGVSDETTNFDPDTEVIRPEVRARLERFHAKMKRGLIPTQKDITEVASAEPEAAKRHRYRRILEETLVIVKMVDARNEYIASVAIAQKTDVVILIGAAHVPGLISAFDRHCHSNAN